MPDLRRERHYEMTGGVCPSVCRVPAVVFNAPRDSCSVSRPDDDFTRNKSGNENFLKNSLFLLKTNKLSSLS